MSLAPVPSANDRCYTRTAFILGLGALLVLVGFAWAFYLERTACFDSAFISWLLFDQRLPQSVLGRHSAWIPQLLPVLLIRSGSSMETILRSYSVCIAMFHVLLYLLIALRVKDRAATLALPIAMVAGFHYMFYYGFSELYQGMSVMVLAWACLRRYFAATRAAHQRGWALAVVLAACACAYYHQLLVLPLMYMLGLEALWRRQWANKGFFLITAAVVSWFVFRILLMSSSSYEQSRMPSLEVLLHYSTRLGELRSTEHLLLVWGKFKALLILMATTGAGLLVARRWGVLVWTTAFSIGFMMLTLITDRDGGSPIIYENYYPVIGLAWAMAFAVLVVNSAGLRVRRATMAVQATVLALGLMQVHRGHHRLSAKVEYAHRITTQLREQGTPKAVGAMVSYPWRYTFGFWPTGMETILASAVNGPHSCATLYLSDEDERTDSLMHDPNIFLGPSWAPGWFSIDHLDTNFFRLPMGHGYTRVNTRAQQPLLAVQARLDAPERTVRAIPDRYTVVPITVTDLGGIGISSLDTDGSPVMLSCRLFRADGRLYQEQEPSCLELDIRPGSHYTTGLIVERPNRSGIYGVTVGLMVDGRSLGPTTSFLLQVPALGL